jgi:hypothetical protein
MCVAGLIALLSPSPAAAGGAAPAPLSQSLSGEAKAAYDSGRLLFEDGDSPGALAKFAHSYELSHDPRLLWNMATCEKELRHYARASMLIGRYLKEGGTRIPADQRQSAIDTQNALRAFYVQLKINGLPEGATVFVDGTPAGQAPLSEPLLVDLGERNVRVEQPGFEPSDNRLEVAGGGELMLTVTLKPVSVVSVAAPRLSVQTSGARDIVAIDGKVVGSQHWEGTLSVGEHTVRVTADHKKPYETRLQLPAGSSRSLQITLEDESHGANIWPWIAGGAAVVAGAAVGGYFLLRPSQESTGATFEGKLATLHLKLGGAP